MEENSSSEVMISALQHYLFCPRQFALIHIEQLWSENYLTASGRILHERVDSPDTEKHPDIRYATALRIFSKSLNLCGIADMVEFHKKDVEHDAAGQKIAVVLDDVPGYWSPYPVEYKRGKPKEHQADEVQLCAQAMCLEEMLHVFIPEGALFYGQPRRRTRVLFDNELRTLTTAIARKANDLILKGITLDAAYSKSCDSCSLYDYCRPKAAKHNKSAQLWLDKEIQEALL